MTIRVGITGITGGFGRRLSELLTEQKVTIYALVRKESNTENLSPDIELIYGNICDFESVCNFVKDIDICIHLAAQVQYSSKKELYDININGTDNICRAILLYNPKCRLIHCSTISVLKVNPLFKFLSSTYGISKYLAEKRVLHYIKKANLHATIIYPGLIYGKYDKSFLPQVIFALKKGHIRLIKGGEHNAPVIDADELGDLFIRAALNPASKGKRYIAVKGVSFGIHDVIKMIAEKMTIEVPNKIYSRLPLFILAIFVEAFYKLFRKTGKPPINKTVINVMSINFKTYKKVYNNPETDLTWKQDISKAYFKKRIDEILPFLTK